MDKVTIHCDGAAIPNPGVGGWGAVLRYGSAKKEISGHIPHCSNNVAELVAAMCALAALKRPCEVVLYSDSQYLISTMNGDYSRKTNLEYWQLVDAAAERHQVTWVWVRGHNGDPDNERAHQLAEQVIRRMEG